MQRLKFGRWNCIPVRKSYGNPKNLRIELRDATTWEPVAVATVNTGEKLQEDMAYIKSYSENTGMLETLMEAGVVTAVMGYIESGFEVLYLVRVDLSKLFQEK